MPSEPDRLLSIAESTSPELVPQELAANARRIDVELLAMAWVDSRPFRAGQIRSGCPRTSHALAALLDAQSPVSSVWSGMLDAAEISAIFDRVKRGPPFGPPSLLKPADADTKILPLQLSTLEIFEPLPPVRWLCEAIELCPGAPMLIAGYGFSGKTVATQDLALAVASGTPVWGTFPVRQGRVLHLDYEQGRFLTCTRYQRLARGRGIEPAALGDRLALVPLPDFYLDSDAEDRLARLCEGVDLLIIDSLRASSPSHDENSSEIRVVLDQLTRISDATGVAALVLHHARKPMNKAPGGILMSIRGSGAVFDACGSVLVLEAKNDRPIVAHHEKARITGRTRPDFELQIEDVLIDGESAAGLRVQQVDAGRTDLSVTSRCEATKVAILDLLAHGPVPGANVLRERLGLKRDLVYAVVAELVGAGIVEKSGTQNKPLLALRDSGTGGAQ